MADCAIWGVVTTIFEPTESILLFAKRVTDACVVVVGDRKTNHSRWGGVPKNVFYLSPSEQESLCYTILQHVPWNHFGRKNIGYMYAIAAGAQRIFDFDDDYKLKAGMENDLHKTFGKCSVSQPKHLYYNPYPDLQDPIDDTVLRGREGFPSSSYATRLRTRNSASTRTYMLQSFSRWRTTTPTWMQYSASRDACP